MRLLIIITLLSIFNLGRAFVQVNDEKRLAAFLLAGYGRVGRLGRPVSHLTDRWNVTIGLSLLSVTDVNLQSQTVEVVMWQTLIWNDVYLKWEKTGFAVNNVRLHPSDIAVPDITLYNAASQPESLAPQALVVVDVDGNAVYVPPIRQRFICHIPSDTDQVTCSMKFGSWTYNGDQLNLMLQGKKVNLEQYVAGQDWEVVSTAASRNEVHYECCSESYIDVTYNITMRRK